MQPDTQITLFHSPRTRSGGVLLLLEELGIPYTLHPLNMKAGEHRSADYLRINPLGKVPAIRHADAVLTEQVAIYIYLADAFPKAGLAPSIGDPLRASYLRWMVYYAACYEPALVDVALKREPAPHAMSPYGSFDEMLATISAPIETSSYLLGDTFSAADLLWGRGLRMGEMFGIIKPNAAMNAYLERVTSRPAFARVQAIDAELAAR